MAFQGGCACKAVRYEVSADPVATMNCHCRACQYASGGGFSTVVVVPRGTIRIVKGAPKGHASKGDSGKTVTRYFCIECGSPVYSDPELGPMQVVKAATLDDPSKLVMTGSLYTSEAQPWAHVDPAKPSFPKMPPGAG
jgi:hypothetical protein